MYHKNIFKSNLLDRRNTDNILYLLEKAVDSFNFSIDYYSYNTATKEFDDPFKIKIFFDVENDSPIQSGLKFDMTLDFLTLSKYFVNYEIEPKLNDKIVYNNNIFYVSNIVYYNRINNETPSIHNSLVINIRAIKKTNIKLSEI